MKTKTDWSRLAERRLKRILSAALLMPALKKRAKSPSWAVDLKLLGAPAMKRLNARYRRKDYATDVLSFNAPRVFQAAGHLGELVICLPVLKRQARERAHSEQIELEVLLVHGVLHLLGLDHELGPRQAAEMARWEMKVLAKTLPRAQARGLIAAAR